MRVQPADRLADGDHVVSRPQLVRSRAGRRRRRTGCPLTWALRDVPVGGEDLATGRNSTGTGMRRSSPTLALRPALEDVRGPCRRGRTRRRRACRGRPAGSRMISLICVHEIRGLEEAVERDHDLVGFRRAEQAERPPQRAVRVDATRSCRRGGGGRRPREAADRGSVTRTCPVEVEDVDVALGVVEDVARGVTLTRSPGCPGQTSTGKSSPTRSTARVPRPATIRMMPSSR